MIITQKHEGKGTSSKRGLNIRWEEDQTCFFQTMESKKTGGRPHKAQAFFIHSNFHFYSPPCYTLHVFILPLQCVQYLFDQLVESGMWLAGVKSALISGHTELHDQVLHQLSNQETVSHLYIGFPGHFCFHDYYLNKF